MAGAGKAPYRLIQAPKRIVRTGDADLYLFRATDTTSSDEGALARDFRNGSKAEVVD